MAYACKSYGWSIIGVSNDLGAMRYNIGGLALVKKVQSKFMYSELFTNLDTERISLNYGGFGLPFTFGTIGIDYEKFSDKGYYYEHALSLGYAKKIKKHFYFGVGVSYLKHKYKPDLKAFADPVFKVKQGEENFGVNCGVLYKNKNFTTGVNLRNMNKPDVGLKTEDIVPLEVRYGFSYSFFNNNLLVASDFSYRDAEWGNNRDKTNIHCCFSIICQSWVA